MTELTIVFAIAGLIIMVKFGIKPELDKRINNTDTIEKHYKENR
jgi:hypothetical protein